MINISSETAKTISTTLLWIVLTILPLAIGVFLIRNYRLSKRLLLLTSISILALILGIYIRESYQLFKKQQATLQSKNKLSSPTPIIFYPQSLNFWDSIHLYFENPNTWKFFNQTYEKKYLFRFKYPKIFTPTEGDRLVWLTKDGNLPGYIMIAEPQISDAEFSRDLSSNEFTKIVIEKNRPFYKLKDSNTKPLSDDEVIFKKYWSSYSGVIEGVGISILASKQLPENVVLGIIRSIEIKSDSP